MSPPPRLKVARACFLHWLQAMAGSPSNTRTGMNLVGGMHVRRMRSVPSMRGRAGCYSLRLPKTVSPWHHIGCCISVYRSSQGCWAAPLLPMHACKVRPLSVLSQQVLNPVRLTNATLRMKSSITHIRSHLITLSWYFV